MAGLLDCEARITDEIFMARLHGYTYATQRKGYGDGPVPDNFQPIILFFRNSDGTTIDRKRTLDGFPEITGVERKMMLVVDLKQETINEAR